MKTSSIISKVIATGILLFTVTIWVSAQSPTPPTPPSTTSTTTSRSQQKIDINRNGNKISLKVNDDVFDLNMVYDFDATDVIAAITDELGSPQKAGRFMKWENTGYDIHVKDGNLQVFINRNKTDRSFARSIQNILEELFKDLELDIEINNYN